MKQKIFLTSVALAAMLSACNSSSDHSSQKNSADSLSTAGNTSAQTFNLDTTTLSSGASYYQCEMDPEVISDKPGSCSKCGMELTALKKL
jgi:hypothetical protein